MRDYYEAELRLLREEALIFANSHPDIAGRLGLHFPRDQDPQAERLLEAVAYLTADLKRELDEKTYASAYMQVGCPTWLRDYPSCLIGRIKSPTLGHRVTGIPTDSRLVALQDTKPPLEFTNPIGSHYQPVVLCNVAIQHHDDEHSSILLELNIDSNASRQDLLKAGLQIYLNDAWSNAYELYHMLLRLTFKIELYQSADDGSARQSGWLPRGAHLSVDSCFLPNDQKHPFDLWLDYFNFKEKYLFIDFLGFDASLLDASDPVVFLHIHLRGMSHHLTFREDALVMNAAVFMNVYTRACEPLRVHPGRVTYPLTVEADRDNQHIHALYKIEAMDEAGLIHRLLELSDRENHDAGGMRYSLKQKSLSKAGSHYYLALHNYKDLKTYRLSITAWVHDGPMPYRQLYRGMKVGELVLTDGRLEVEALTAPTMPSRIDDPALSNKHASKLYASNFEDFTSLASFQRLLKALNSGGHAADKSRIEGLLNLKVHRSNIVDSGVVKACVHYTFALRLSNYLNLGDMFLFGQVMYSFLYAVLPINHALKLLFTDENTQPLLVWSSENSQKLNNV